MQFKTFFTPRNARYVAATLLALPIAQSVSAAGLSSTQDVQKLEGVTVSAQAATSSQLSASSGIVVSEQIEQRPISRPGELLETVPGLIVTQHSGEGKANQYFLRGFNLDHGTDMATFIDGMPVNMRTHGHGQGYTDINFIIPEMIESLSYKKGPFHGDEGDFANAGVARLHTKNQLDKNLVKLTLGEHNYQRLLLAGGDDKWLAAVDHTQYDGPWQVPQDQEKTSLLLKRQLGNVVNGGAISLMAYENTWTATDQLPQRYVDAGGDRYDSLDKDSGGDSHRYSLNGELWWDVAGKPLQANLYAIDYGLELFANHTYALNGAAGDEMRQHDERRILGGGFDYLFLQNNAGRFRTVLDVRHDDISDVGLSASADREITQRTIRHKVQETGVGLGLIHQYDWHPSFTTELGLRWDYLRAEVKNRLTGDSSRKADDLINPKFSARYAVTEDTQLFVNYGFGFHSNDARGFAEGNVDDDTQKATVFARSEGADLGVHTKLTDTLQTSLSLWWLTLDSELIFVGDDGTTEASDKSQRYGLESSVFWQPTTGVIVDADLALTKARLQPEQGAEQYIPGAIERVFSVGVSLHDAGPWNAGLRLRHFGEFALNEDNSERGKAVTLLNAQVGYAVTPELNLSLDGINLTNQTGNDITYWYESQLTSETAPVEDKHFHPVEPRMFRATLALSF